MKECLCVVCVEVTVGSCMASGRADVRWPSRSSPALSRPWSGTHPSAVLLLFFAGLCSWPFRGPVVTRLMRHNPFGTRPTPPVRLTTPLARLRPMGLPRLCLIWQCPRHLRCRSYFYCGAQSASPLIMGINSGRFSCILA